MRPRSYGNGRGMGGHHLPNEGVTDTWLTPPGIPGRIVDNGYGARVRATA